MHVSPGAPGVMPGADAVYYRGDVRDGVVTGAVKYDAADEKLSAQMMRLLASFVTRYNPNFDPSSPQWPVWKPKQQQYPNLYRQQLGQ